MSASRRATNQRKNGSGSSSASSCDSDEIPVLGAYASGSGKAPPPLISFGASSDSDESVDSDRPPNSDHSSEQDRPQKQGDAREAQSFRRPVGSQPERQALAGREVPSPSVPSPRPTPSVVPSSTPTPSVVPSLAPAPSLVSSPMPALSTVSSSANVPETDTNPPADQLHVFTVAWAVKTITRQKVKIRMCENDVALFFAKSVTLPNVGPSWLIMDQDVEADPTSSHVCGRLTRKKRSRRWALTTREVEGETLGFAFYDIDGKRRSARAFRVVFPKTHPYNNTSKDTELSWLAKLGNINDNYEMFSSKHPVKKEGAEVLNFGGVFLEPSLKNFIVEDHDRRQIFVIYKSSSGTCTVKVAPPFTPVIAFALSIAVVTSDS